MADGDTATGPNYGIAHSVYVVFHVGLGGRRIAASGECGGGDSHCGYDLEAFHLCFVIFCDVFLFSRKRWDIYFVGVKGVKGVKGS